MTNQMLQTSDNVFHRPRSIDDATALLADGGWTVVAGATDVYPAEVGRRFAGRMLDVTAIDELRGIERLGDGWRIGSCATWTDIATAALPDQFAALQQAAVQVGGVQIQNRATIGGNLCTASPAGDGIPVMMAMSAKVELARHEQRRLVPIEEFVTGYRTTALAPDELVVGLHVPQRTGRSDFQKLGSRSHLVISIAMVATHVEPGPTPKVRVAVGACSPVARRIRGLEQLLADRPEPDIATGYGYPELDPIDDVRAGARYRHTVVGSLVARSIVNSLAPGVGT